MEKIRDLNATISVKDNVNDTSLMVKDGEGREITWERLTDRERIRLIHSFKWWAEWLLDNSRTW